MELYCFLRKVGQIAGDGCWVALGKQKDKEQHQKAKHRLESLNMAVQNGCPNGSHGMGIKLMIDYGSQPTAIIYNIKEFSINRS
jgi:hypothetical protein